MNKQFFLLQVNDALFPIGGYSHSYGLETYIQKGIVHDTDSARDYLFHKLKDNLLYNDLFAVRLSYEYVAKGQIDQLIELNQLTEAGKVPSELRDASLKMGSRFLKTIQGLNIPFEIDFLSAFVNAAGNKKIHHACLYGAFCASVGIEQADALSHYLYAQTSAIVTTCVKSIPLSQTDGQKILVSSFPLLSEMLEEVTCLPIRLYGCSAPAFDIRSMQHEALYSRIYMS